MRRWDSRCPFPVSSYLFQTIMNKLWLGLDLTEAIAAPILHVNSKGHVEYEPKFNEVRLRSHRPPETHVVLPCKEFGNFLCQGDTLHLQGPRRVEKFNGKTIGLSHGIQVRE